MKANSRVGTTARPCYLLKRAVSAASCIHIIQPHRPCISTTVTLSARPPFLYKAPCFAEHCCFTAELKIPKSRASQKRGGLAEEPISRHRTSSPSMRSTSTLRLQPSVLRVSTAASRAGVMSTSALSIEARREVLGASFSTICLPQRATSRVEKNCLPL